MVMEEVVKEAHTIDVPPPRQAGPVDHAAGRSPPSACGQEE